MHVEVNAPGEAAAVENIPGGNGRVPNGDIRGGLERDVEQARSGVENPLLDAIVSEIRTHGLRIEIEVGAGVLVLPVEAAIRRNRGNVWLLLQGEGEQDVVLP